MSNINPREPGVIRTKGTRIIQQQLELLRTTAVLGSNADRWVEVSVPSARISMMGEVFYEFDSGDFDIGSGSFGPSTWVVQARAKGINTLTDQLHTIESLQQLPRSYETDSAVKVVRFKTSLNCPVNAIAVAQPGRWYFRAYWEPNDSSIDDKELELLFGVCKAQIVYSS